MCLNLLSVTYLIFKAADYSQNFYQFYIKFFSKLFLEFYLEDLSGRGQAERRLA